MVTTLLFAFSLLLLHRIAYATFFRAEWNKLDIR